MPIVSKIAGRTLRLPRPLTRELVVERDLAIPMDDGVTLYADRYAPPGTDRAPTVLVRSPYGRRGAFGFLYGRLIAERGLQVLIQSVRGTFGSGGEFDPFDERADGLATLRWLKRQPWHTGKVGTIGPSYMGLVQWAIADELDAMAPSVTASQFRGMAVGSGSLSLDTTLSWMLLLHTQERRLAPLLLANGLRRTLPGVYDHVPIGELDERAFGRQIPYFRRWMEELSPDSPYWATRDFSSSVGDVTAPVQLTGGWHDIFLPWMLEDFKALCAAGRHPQLIIGPWTHTSPGMTGVSLREGVGWLREQLLGDGRMVRDTPVRIYVTGSDRRWIDLPEWPPPGGREQPFFLHAGGGLDTVAPLTDAAPSRYRYDPADPTPALGGAMLLERNPVRDNRPLEARPDVLTFTTGPLERDVEAIGPVRADIRLRSSTGHTDVFVRVCDVQPDGASLNVCDGLVRLTPEEPGRDADGVATVAFELWPTAHRFGAGHRIRVQVSSGAHPRYARNPGTGEDPVSATTLVAADQEVFHDPSRPSSVTLTLTS
ncbi:MAG TPA: CocE/NonD family hydrolase [Capillimicrobium sp.]|nr:CocE/NonD family hydrolase [Capillimicrobium sp.]